MIMLVLCVQLFRIPVAVTKMEFGAEVISLNEIESMKIAFAEN